MAHEDHRDCSIPPHASVNTGNFERIANLTIPSAGHSIDEYGYEPDPTTNSMQDRRRQLTAEQRQAMHAAWLKSSVTWTDGLGEGWFGIRVLGQGGNGIAGHWNYQPGSIMAARHDRDLHNRLGLPMNVVLPRAVTDIVVKQARAGDGGLLDEARIMRSLNQARSEHIPRLYRNVIRAVGSGVPHLHLDNDRREVHRMIMEYLPGGDMDQMIHRCQNSLRQDGSGGFLREELCWSAFDCLVRAFTVIDRGQETGWPDSEDWLTRRLVHYDLKPQNVFIGSRDMGLHQGHPIHKVGDYGLAETPPPVAQQNRTYQRNTLNRGTTMTLAPEQNRNNAFSFVSWNGAPSYDAEGRPQMQIHDHLPSSRRIYGRWTNIYQIGCCMYMLMCLTTRFPTGNVVYRSGLHPDLASSDTVGIDLERGIFLPRPDPHHSHGPLPGQVLNRIGQVIPAHMAPQPIRLPYSTALRALVLQCLVQDPMRRPDLPDLRNEIDSAMLRLQTQPADDSIGWADVDLLPIDQDGPPRVQTALRSHSLDPQRWQPGRDSQSFAPLSELVDLVEQDRLRREQIANARAMRQNRAAGIAASNNRAVRLRAAGFPQAPSVFHLTIHIYDHAAITPFFGSLPIGAADDGEMLADLLECIEDYGPINTAYFMEMRVARLGAVPGSDAYDLNQDGLMLEVARPTINPLNGRREAILEVHNADIGELYVDDDDGDVAMRGQRGTWFE